MSKLHSTNSGKQSLKALIIVISIIFAPVIFWHSYGYVFALISPQYSHVDKEAQYDITNVDPENRFQKFNVDVGSPKNMFLGVETISFAFEIEKGRIIFIVSRDDLEKSIKAGNDIKIDNGVFEISDNFFGSKAMCFSTTLNNNINGHLAINDYRQGFKKIKLEGELTFERIEFLINVRCYYENLREEEQTVSMSPITIRLKLDSSINYTWAGKGGPTYKL